MATKKNDRKTNKPAQPAQPAPQSRGPGGPSVRKMRDPQPLGRGLAPPDLLRHAPKTYAFRLEPKSKIHAPIEVWGYRTDDGWNGWIEGLRNSQIRPTHWSAESWNELPALNDRSVVAKKLA